MTNNPVIIIQARMTSTRLPGKVLKPVLGKPLLAYQLERLRRCKTVNQIVIATTINETDEPIVAFCKEQGVPFYRGSENDVLSRYYEAAVAHQADPVIRVTSDCPIIDPQVVDQVIQFYLANQAQYDYVSTALKLTYPRGMDTEVCSFKALTEAHHEGILDYEREHVTPFIYRRPERYRLGVYSYQQDVSSHRWTVDTPEDFELIRRIIEALYPAKPDFTLEDILALIAQNPEWAHINAHIEQKKLPVS